MSSKSDFSSETARDDDYPCQGEACRAWWLGRDRERAPREAAPTDLRRECPSCDQRTPVIVDESDTEVIFYCKDCGTETGQYT